MLTSSTLGLTWSLRSLTSWVKSNPSNLFCRVENWESWGREAECWATRSRLRLNRELLISAVFSKMSPLEGSGPGRHVTLVTSDPIMGGDIGGGPLVGSLWSNPSREPRLRSQALTRHSDGGLIGDKIRIVLQIWCRCDSSWEHKSFLHNAMYTAV